MTAVEVLTQDVLVACILLGLTALVGLLGNVLMMRALLLYKDLRVDLYLFFGSVAVADILCLAIAVPEHIIYITMSTSPVTDAWCKASKYLEVGSGFVASYHLVILTVLRATLLTSRGFSPPTPVQTMVCVLIVWFLAMLGAVPFLLVVEDVEGYCHYKMGTDVEKDVWLLNSFSCFIPILIILAIYLLTHLVSKRYFNDSYSYREKQMSRLITVIVVTFIVCQLPFRALDLHLYYQETEAEHQAYPDEDKLESLYIARNYLLCLMMADKAARPVIYSKLAPNLAGAFDEVINCTLCHRAYTQGRTGHGGRSSGNQMTNSHSARIPSTSSNAPLTGGYSESGASNVNAIGALSTEELEIVQL